MDKKMHRVSEKIMTAEKAVKGGMKKKAIKVLSKAEKDNEKLVKIDKNVRDPIIDKYKKLPAKCKKPMKKGK